ncbi:MAG: hypothetical protein ACJAWI_000719 [Marinomonas primoryensis]|jgi:hypothetical protein
MNPYKFIEKLTVLQHPDTRQIVRLMIEHDGQQNYGLQRSILKNGTTRHFYNKKIWHSPYNIKLELNRRVSDYENKGFDVMTEISLRPNDVPTCPVFSYSIDCVAPNVKAFPINATDIPISVDCSFHQLSIRDLRYDTEITDKGIITFFKNLRKAIEFLPFEMVAVWSEKSINVLTLEFSSKPQPKHAVNYIRMLSSKKHSAFTIINATGQDHNLEQIDDNQSYAVLTGGSLTFHLASTWKIANVFLEKYPHAAKFSVYCIDSEIFKRILHDVPLNNFERSGNAEILFTHSNNQISGVTFIRSLGFDVTIDNLNILI